MTICADCLERARQGKGSAEQTSAEQLKAAITLVRHAAYGYKANFFDRNEFLMHLANIEQQAAV